MRRVAPVVLDLFLVVSDLLLDPVGREVERVVHVAVLVGGNELVLVLGVSDDLDVNFSLAFAVKVDRDRDLREPIKVMEQFLGLFLELLLGLVRQLPVPGRYCHLHGEPRFESPAAASGEAAGWICRIGAVPTG
jgi:hypothetical protein